MDFKSLLNSLDQLSEATKETGKGRIHTSEPGGYGRKDDEDEEGNKVKSDAPKKGRGRPKKDADSSGEVKKYDFSAFGATGKDVKLPKYDKKKTTKHSLKEYLDQLDKALNENDQIQIKPASQVPNKPGQSSMQKPPVGDQSQKNTQVIQLGDKTLGTVDNPQLAQQIKQSIGKGEMTLAGAELDEAGYSAKAARAGKDIGKPGKNFGKIAASASQKYGSKEAGERVAGAVLSKLRSKQNEALMPSDDSTAGAGLGAGRNPNVLERSVAEGKKAKPDFLDLDKDGNKKESMKKATSDKKKVKEGTDHRLKSARHRGKSHALAKEGYNCKYDDMQEARAYHDGFKEGLDECYGMYPMRGVVGEEMPSTVPGMAMQADPMIGEMDKTEYMQQQARSTSGDTFKAFGQTFKDTEVLESPFAFEAWDKELNALLESKEEVAEGVTISSSTGQQGMPDSVSISATDADANKVLSFIKQLGIGAFSNQGDSESSYGNPEVQNGSSSHSGIEVMGDHDGMMSLMKKVSGHGGQGQDYENEEDHQHEEETCNECGGMMEAGHSCGSKEMVDEVETEDQMEYEVAEAEEVVNNNDEAEEEESDAQRDSALATAAGANFAKVDEDEAEDDELEESYANSADDDFTADSEFMTDTITGGLNKKKSTGQTTIPVIAGQNDRMGYNVSESLSDWKMLAGIK